MAILPNSRRAAEREAGRGLHCAVCSRTRRPFSKDMLFDADDRLQLSRDEVVQVFGQGIASGKDLSAHGRSGDRKREHKGKLHRS